MVIQINLILHHKKYKYESLEKEKKKKTYVVPFVQKVSWFSVSIKELFASFSNFIPKNQMVMHVLFY